MKYLVAMVIAAVAAMAGISVVVLLAPNSLPAADQAIAARYCDGLWALLMNDPGMALGILCTACGTAACRRRSDSP